MMEKTYDLAEIIEALNEDTFVPMSVQDIVQTVEFVTKTLPGLEDRLIEKGFTEPERKRVYSEISYEMENPTSVY